MADPSSGHYVFASARKKRNAVLFRILVCFRHGDILKIISSQHFADFLLKFEKFKINE